MEGWNVEVNLKWIFQEKMGCSSMTDLAQLCSSQNTFLFDNAKIIYNVETSKLEFLLIIILHCVCVCFQSVLYFLLIFIPDGSVFL